MRTIDINSVHATAVHASHYVTGAVDVRFALTLPNETQFDGETTLVRDHMGDWVAWGELANWLDGRSIATLLGSCNWYEVKREIESVCSEAARLSVRRAA